MQECRIRSDGLRTCLLGLRFREIHAISSYDLLIFHDYSVDPAVNPSFTTELWDGSPN